MPARSDISSALERLVAAARALPGETAPVTIPDPLASPAPEGAGSSAAAATVTVRDEDAAPPDREALRRRVGALLAGLAERIEPTLADALARATRAWDQVDALTLIDPAARGDAERLVAEWRRLHRAAIAGDTPEPCADAAAALEALMTIDAALGLASLLERRMATLARLRVRSAEPSLLPGGRPFLDLAAALAEAARGWM